MCSSGHIWIANRKRYPAGRGSTVMSTVWLSHVTQCSSVLSFNLLLMLSDAAIEISVSEGYDWSFLSVLKTGPLQDSVVAVLLPTPNTTSGFALLSPACTYDKGFISWLPFVLCAQLLINSFRYLVGPCSSRLLIMSLIVSASYIYDKNRF